MSEQDRNPLTDDEDRLFNSPDPTASQLEIIQEIADRHRDVYAVANEEDRLFGSPDPTASQLDTIQEIADRYLLYAPWNSPDPTEEEVRRIADMEREVEASACVMF